VGSKSRQSDTSLRQRFFREFYKFSFFKAVDLLESLYPDRKPLGQTLQPNKEAVRFSVKPGFSFPASDISKVRQGDGSDQVNMEVTFMGLIGPAGVLPHWYNELVMERIYKKDLSLASFLDMFHHRLISLFYLVWKKHRFPENYLPDGKDRLSGYLLSLVGLGSPGLTRMIGLPKESLAFYSGLLSRPLPSAVTIEAVVEYFSGTAVQIEQFIERMLPLSPEDQTQLGLANSRLGVDTVFGSFVWDCQATFRINLGPVTHDHFLRLLPSGDLLRPIFSLVKYMVGLEYEFEIRVFHKRQEVPPCVLGMEPPTSPRLGWTTWIRSPGVSLRDDPYVTFQESELISSMAH
jgi:type VI secretion system protein ImpH